jgi:hypothetical protein
MLDAQRQQAIDRVRADVVPAYGGRLLCLALYGSGVGDDYVAGKSDLNFAIVLDRVGIGDLRQLRAWLPAWHELGVGTPLVIDSSFLRRALDVFPIELEDIRAAHIVVAGDDVFAGLELAAVDLRRELEQEARAKLLRLRMAYAESGGRREDIESLMSQSVVSFVVIMRAMLRLRVAQAPMRLLPVIALFEEAGGCRLPAIRQAAHVKLGTASPSGDGEADFAAYLEEVEKVIAIIDQL